MKQPVVQVDAFTDTPFAGNPAAVCVLDGPRETSWMQAVALEMNLSETAFVHPENSAYRLRWFTPTVEVELCGHATLASAHVLFDGGIVPPDATMRFETLSGALTASREGGWIRLDFPAREAVACDLPPGVEAALGCFRIDGVPLLTSIKGRKQTRGGSLRAQERPSSQQQNALGAAAVWSGKNVLDYLVELESEAAVRSLQPDHRALRAIGLRGVMVTAPSATSSFDFVSRFFAPGSGIDEDPVTGSAHCALGPYWAGKLGKQDLVGYQASARGGVVRTQVRGARVHLLGQAVVTMRGELTV